jgi:hypothetical protein
VISSDELPEPETGMVVRYDYQWIDQKQPQKARPACVAFFKLRPDPRTPAGSEDAVFVKEVIYFPISTKPPHADQAAVKIPDQVRRHLGLPDQSWIIISECNVQYWPNDLSRVPGSGKWIYGFFPPRFFRSLRDQLVVELKSQRLKMHNVRYLPPRSRS